MRENILHYIWRFQKFNSSSLKTSCGKDLIVYNPGNHNNDSGPDFLCSRLQIGNEIWIGQVEVHIRASDWKQHSHHQDEAFDNVILHVVWEYDDDIYRKDLSKIPVLIMKSYVSNKLIKKYQEHFDIKPIWINCEKDFWSVPELRFNHWIERLFIMRLQRKTSDLKKQLAKTKNNWEEVLFHNLCKSFGLKLNSDAFFSMAQSIPYLIVQKNRNSLLKLEALFLGQARLLESEIYSDYHHRLKSEYQFLKHKYQLENSHVIKPKYFRLRPSNFPTIRLSQLAKLYNCHTQLFSKLIISDNKNDILKILTVSASSFWETHYTFGKSSKKLIKKTSSNFIRSILINTIVPMKMAYMDLVGSGSKDYLVELMRSIKSEKNSILRKFNKLRQMHPDALESQALVELKIEYCDKNKCLDCEIGNYLLNRNM